MKLLVCGGRDFNDQEFVFSALDSIDKHHGIECIVHGGANGVDKLAGKWATLREKNQEIYPAKWLTHGKSAGPIRNKEMLDTGKPDWVLALPGGIGTENMVQQSLKYKFGVWRYPGC